jgi:Photosystem II protein Y (PsbY)
MTIIIFLPVAAAAGWALFRLCKAVDGRLS